MDHALRSISYIADIGELVVLMARRRVTSEIAAVAPGRFERRGSYPLAGFGAEVELYAPRGPVTP